MLFSAKVKRSSGILIPNCFAFFKSKATPYEGHFGIISLIGFP